MIHLIADTHLNHRFLVDNGFRPSDYERRLLCSVSQLKPSDWLIHLGDVSIGEDDKTHRQFNELCAAHHRILIRGNHDKHSIGWYLERGWSHVTDGMILNRFGRTILLTHEPVSIPPWADLNIHGHLHAGVHRQGPDTPYHSLISCEFQKYKTISLKTVVFDGQSTMNEGGYDAKRT